MDYKKLWLELMDKLQSSQMIIFLDLGSTARTQMIDIMKDKELKMAREGENG